MVLKKIVLFLFFITVSFATLCCDGTISNSTGKGTCSHHGGVCETSSCSKPDTPYFITASDGEYENKITVSWTKIIDATYYKIYSKSASSSRYKLIASHYQEASYTYYTTDTDVKEFKVVACNSCGCSSGVTDTGYILPQASHQNTPLCSEFTVIDGDTLEYRGIKYRLYGIDAPESYDGKKMEYDAKRCGVSEDEIRDAGYLAKVFVTHLLQNSTQKCTIDSRYKDAYGREVAIIYFAQDTSLNETLIANGYAIAWDKYIKEDKLKTSWNRKEQEAAAQKKGLWQRYCKLMNCLTKQHYSCNITSSPLHPITMIEQKVINHSYTITGYFAPYHFGNDSKSNWTFTSATTHTTYQLLGDTSPENIKRMGVFSWKRVDVVPNPPSFYMVRFEDDPFGWLIFNIDKSGNCQNIYKLAGQDPKTKAFSYDLDGDGQRDSLQDLGCKVDGNKVKFFWK